MKRIMKIVFITLIICSIPIATLFGQDKCKMKHIKVVVVDKPGNRTELDTLLKEYPMTDSIKLKGEEDEDIIIVKGGKHVVEGKGADVMVWSSDKTGSKGGNVIYINEGKEDLKNGEKSFDVHVSTDDSGKKVEKTKYVLAKDGMVISIEGNDEAKVKDLVKDIESKMGVNKGGTTAKPVVK